MLARDQSLNGSTVGHTVGTEVQHYCQEIKVLRGRQVCHSDDTEVPFNCQEIKVLRKGV